MKNFKIQEFVCRCGCEMPAEARQNIEALVANVLDPVRDEYGKPIYVNSGYRCEAHNRKVDGVPKSQHLLGQAADIRPSNTDGTNRRSATVSGANLTDLAKIIVSQGKFDQLILYPTFLHVSFKRNGNNRHKVLKKTSTGYAEISHREIC